MIEIWRDVIGYQGLYQVSNFGRVRGLEYRGKKRKVPKILKGRANGGQYLQVQLWKDKKYKNLYIHRLVCQVFILGRKMKKEEFCDHINTIRTDNRLENLRVCTCKQNNNNPLTIAKRLGNGNANKQLDLIEVEYPHREFTFINSCECSRFFNYKNKMTIGTYIFNSRKNNSNIIRIKGRDYYYSQEQKGKK